MTPHLTNRDMELFANNNLPPAELLAIDSHLAECDRCRSSLLQISGGSEKMHDLRRVLSSDLIAAHLTYEELASCADGASESAAGVASCAAARPTEAPAASAMKTTTAAEGHLMGAPVSL